ncbi:MAG: hypothetical protein MZV70_29240 [Desulfobacterales bacterium]|nr:hypothetical protein [Desulfobacterales bacterium]
MRNWSTREELILQRSLIAGIPVGTVAAVLARSKRSVVCKTWRLKQELARRLNLAELASYLVSKGKLSLS